MAGYRKKIRKLVLEILATGPKKLGFVVETLETYGLNNTADSFSGVKPIQAAVLYMLNTHEIELTADRYLKIP